MKDENNALVAQALMEQRHRKNTATVTNGLQTFYEVGMALAEIRDSKSYKLVAQFDTFEAFCRSEWDMSKTNANLYIGSSVVMENVKNDINLCQTPANMGQTIPLQKLKTPEEQQQAWTRVLELAGPDKKVTAKLVKSVVDEFTAPEPPKAPEQPELDVGPSPAVRAAFGPQGLEKEALALILREARRGASKKCHPDVNPQGTDMMVEVNRLLDEIAKYFGYEG
jgi:hypothetical protein